MIIANWKCNGSKEMMFSWFENYSKEVDCGDVPPTVGVAPPLIYFGYFNDENTSLRFVEWGVQDVDHLDGSRTGTISVDMLIDMACDFSIIGHSERRQIFNENNNLIRKKLKSLNKRIMTILLSLIHI